MKRVFSLINCVCEIHVTPRSERTSNAEQKTTFDCQYNFQEICRVGLNVMKCVCPDFKQQICPTRKSDRLQCKC